MNLKLNVELFTLKINTKINTVKPAPAVLPRSVPKLRTHTKSIFLYVLQIFNKFCSKLIKNLCCMVFEINLLNLKFEVVVMTQCGKVITECRKIVTQFGKVFTHCGKVSTHCGKVFIHCRKVFTHY